MNGIYTFSIKSRKWNSCFFSSAASFLVENFFFSELIAFPLEDWKRVDCLEDSPRLYDRKLDMMSPRDGEEFLKCQTVNKLLTIFTWQAVEFIKVPAILQICRRKTFCIGQFPLKVRTQLPVKAAAITVFRLPFRDIAPQIPIKLQHGLVDLNRSSKLFLSITFFQFRQPFDIGHIHFKMIFSRRMVIHCFLFVRVNRKKERTISKT